MCEVQASDAKTRLPQLLDEVERGKTIVITRHGRAIASLVLAASIVVAWTFADEYHPVVEAALDRLARDQPAQEAAS